MNALAKLISALLLVSAFTVSSASPSGKRLVIGGPVAEHLYQVACRADAGPWQKGFSEERFTFIGSLTSENGVRFQVAFLSTIWGQSGRATNRLLVYSDKGRYLGRYSGLSSSEPPTIISTSAVKFSVPAEYGNEVKFNAGPPPTMLTDGELYTYEPANPTLNRTAENRRSSLLPAQRRCRLAPR